MGVLCSVVGKVGKEFVSTSDSRQQQPAPCFSVFVAGCRSEGRGENAHCGRAISSRALQAKNALLWLPFSAVERSAMRGCPSCEVLSHSGGLR